MERLRRADFYAIENRKIENPQSEILNRKDSPSPARLRRATSPVKGEEKNQCRRDARATKNHGRDACAAACGTPMPQPPKRRRY
jgi:hypothetical protein